MSDSVAMWIGMGLLLLDYCMCVENKVVKNHRRAFLTELRSLECSDSLFHRYFQFHNKTQVLLLDGKNNGLFYLFKITGHSERSNPPVGRFG